MYYPKKFAQFVLLSCAAIAASVSAEEDRTTEEFTPHGYAGIGAMMWLYADDYTEGMATGVGYHTRLGYQFNEYFALEARASGGGEGDVDGVSVSLDSALSGFLVFSTQTNEKLRTGVYAGYTQAKANFSASAYGFTVSEDSTESGPAFGAFLESSLNDDLSLYLDYGTYIFESDFIFQELSLGVVRRF